MILRVEGLNVEGILRGISFDVKRGETLIIAGESGSGKSTILKAIGGLLDKRLAVGGRILFDGQDLMTLSGNERRRLAGEAIGFIFQNAGASFCPIRTVGEQIFESVRAHRDWSLKDFRTRALALMTKINLAPEVLDEYPFRLSGGMAQRAGILAAMILEPKLLLADEPTSALDAVTAISVVEELMKLQPSIVLVTHDLRIARRMADDVLILRRGEVVEFGTRQQIFDEPGEPYTRELIEAAGL